MTYQIIITEETAANIVIDNTTTNVSITTNEYPITIEYNAVIEQAGSNTTYGNSNVATFMAAFGANTVSTTGNITGGFILGNGSQLTGIAASYGNANVAANLAAFGSNPISTTGNVTAGYVIGNGSALSAITGGNVTGTVANATFATSAGSATTAGTANAVAGANVSGTVANATFATSAGTATSATTAGTVTTAAQPNITSVGTLTSVSSTGNVTANYFLGNGSQLTGLPATYGNANVVANLAALGSNPVSTTGNVTAGYVIGNGSLLSSITGANVTGSVTQANTANTANAVAGANVSGTVAQATVAATANAVAGANVTGTVANATFATSAATATSATTAGTVTTAAQPNITSVGVLTSLSSTGNITGNYILGNGSQLTDLPVQPGTYGNANVVANLAALGSNPVSTTGNVSAGYFVGNGSLLTGLAASYSNTNATSLLASFGSNTISTTGTVTTGNLNITVDAVVTGNLTVNGTTTTVNSNTVTINDKFINVANNAATAAAANGGGLGVGPVGGEYATLTYNSTNNDWNTNIALSATGNITGNYILGNGSQLTGLPVQPGTYGNANVVANIAALGTNPVSTTGNVTAGYVIGNGSLLSSITGANVTGTVANATYATSSGTAGTVTTAAQPNITSVGILTAVNTLGNISATGNITGSYFLGNGSQLTDLPVQPGTYGNANVVANLAALGSNPVSTTGNVTASYVIGNGSLLSSITGANVTGTVANATYALNSNAATFAGTVTDAAQPNITSVGILTAINTSGAISATGNIQGNVFIGNGAGLTNIPAGNIIGAYGNANVAANLAAFANNPISTTGNVTASYLIGNGSLLSSITGANVTGTVANATFATSSGTATSATTAATVTDAAQPNITSVGILTAINTSGAVSATGNIIANNASLTGNLNFGTVVVRNNSNRLYTDDAEFTNVDIGATLDVTGYVSATGNVTGGNLFTGGAVSATGNIQGNVFIGNGAGLTNIPGGNIVGGYGNANVSNFLANGFGSNTIVTTGNITANNFTTSNVITLAGTVEIKNNNNRLYTNDAEFNTLTIGATAVITGNTTTGNLLTGGLASITGNITAANLLFYTGNSGGANGATGSTITTSVNASNANVAIAGVNPYRWTVGTGFSGDYTANADPLNVNRGSQMAIIGTQNLANADPLNSARLLSSTQFINLQGTANVTSTAKRWGAFQSYAQLGNGNISLSISQSVNPGAVLSSMAAAILIGNQANANLGNAIVSHVAGQNAAILAGTGGTIGNAAVVTATISSQANSSTFTTSAIGYMAQFHGSVGTTAGNVIGYYMGSNVTTNVYGWHNTNLHRAATNYYFLRNDDAVAQNQLGSLRAYHTFQATGNTTGTWDINKQNGQVQAVSATGNITIGSYTNFVTTANDSVNNDSQTDTVTLVIEQGSTPYTVTMPTGNAAIRYANGVSTVTATANTTTMINITAFRSAANATAYLTTISPAFS